MDGNNQHTLENPNKCQLCLKRCQELKTLNCQHSFCVCCLQNWMTKMDSPECALCQQMHPSPSLNTLKAELAGNVDQSHGNTKCCCGKCNADFHCQDCSQYLCTSCTNYHKIFPPLKNHTLQAIGPNSPIHAETLHQPMCLLHEKQLEFYCNICKTPICQKCSITEHSENDGQHEPIRGSDAFDNLRKTVNTLMIQADVYKQQAQVGIRKCIKNTSGLSKNKSCLIKNISSTADEIIEFVQERGKALESELDDICDEKMQKCNSQIDDLKSILSGIEEKENYIAKLLKSGDATVLQACKQVIAELQEKTSVLPKTGPRDDGKIYFSSTKSHILSSLKEHGIGNVNTKPSFEIISENPMNVTQYQIFYIEIAQNNKSEVDLKDLTVTTECKDFDPEDDDEDDEDDKDIYTLKMYRSKERYFVEGSTEKDLKLDVKFCNSSIKGSPINICVQNAGDNKRIKLPSWTVGNVEDLVLLDNGWYAAVSNNCEVYIFENSGAYISKITLLETSMFQRICKLKYDNLILCDIGNRNVTICKVDGQVVKSIPTESVSGIDVNEDLNLVYVADKTANCIHVYNMENNLKVRTIGSQGGLGGQMNGPLDVAVTKEGNVIVADTNNHRVQLFGTDGQFIKVLIGGGDEDGMVIRPYRVGVEYNDNIIVASQSNLKLFDNHGKFLRVINQGGIKSFSIVSHFPRKLALVENYSNMISVIHY